MARLNLKPLHGWRHFLGEVGIIVLGVLIALGFGAVATEIGWQIDSRAAHKAISLELGEALGTAIERTHFSSCVEQRLDLLARIVDQAAIDGRLPPLGDIRSPPVRAWNHGIWDSSVSAQSTSHFDREELSAYVAAYEYIAKLGRTNELEIASWAKLYSLVGPGRKIGEAEIADLRAALSEARLADRFLSIGAHRLKQRIEAYDLSYDHAAMREFADRPSADKEICQPIDSQVPEHYGQSPFRTTLDRVRKSPIRRIAH